MKNLLIISALFVAIYCNAANSDTIPANNSFIEYTGRIDFENPLVPKFSYSGISMRANFEGTSVAAILNDDIGQNYYNVILDGKVSDIINVTTGQQKYMLAEGLKDTIHEIELFKRTELTFGKTEFFGFVVDEGKTLVPITNNREHFIEFIGNSITCGYGNEGVNGQSFGPTTENHYLTYAAITARNFNARHMAVSRSGIGIYRNYAGPSSGNDDCMTNLYTRIFLYDENPKYDFAEQPDLVCINLGTNDFSTPGADSALYIANYFRLIDSIQTKYANPDIVCLLGSMLSGTTLNNVRSYLEFVADSANRKGKGSVSFFEMSAQKGDLGIGIDYHPTVAQHYKNAQELTNYIKNLKGWEINPMLISAKTITAKHIEIEFNTLLNSASNNFSGISIYCDGDVLEVEEVYADTSNNALLHIIPKERLVPNTELQINYTPGTLESEDGIKVPKISNFDIVNSLLATEVVSSNSRTNGVGVKFTFNKNIDHSSTIDGLSLSINQEEVAIDSFTISSKYLQVFFTTSIKVGDAVFASYNGNGIMGEDEVILRHFTNLAVENKSNITGVSNSIESNLRIYPNPSHNGIFNYRWNQSLYNGIKSRYEVVNTAGAIVLEGTLSEIEGQIKLKDRANGVFIIKIYEQEYVQKQLVIVNSIN